MLVQKLKRNHAHMRTVIVSNTTLLKSATGAVVVSEKKDYDPKNFKSDLNHNMVTNSNNSARLFDARKE